MYLFCGVCTAQNALYDPLGIITTKIARFT